MIDEKIPRTVDTSVPRTSKTDSPLRALHQRRRMSLSAVAGLSGLSVSFLSMVENGERRLIRLDHVIAVASALKVAPSKLVPHAFGGIDECAVMPPPVVGFPATGDELSVRRHRDFADELMGYVLSGDGYASAVWLRRIARDPSVNPWLLLDQFTMRQVQFAGSHPGISRPDVGRA